MGTPYEQLKDRLDVRADQFRVRTVAAANGSGIDRKDPLRPTVEALASMPAFVIGGVADLLAAAAKQAEQDELARLEWLRARARRDRWTQGLVSFLAAFAGVAAAHLVM